MLADDLRLCLKETLIRLDAAVGLMVHDRMELNAESEELATDITNTFIDNFIAGRHGGTRT